jgi:hypothetical protein
VTANQITAASIVASSVKSGNEVTNPLAAVLVRGTLVPPADSSFAWVNQGGATSTTGNNGIVTLTAPAVSGDNVRIRKKTLAFPKAGPWAVVMGFIPGMVVDSTVFPGCGMVLRENSTGKLVTYRWTLETTPVVRPQKWTNPTSFSANYVPAWVDAVHFITGQVIYLAIDLDNGTGNLRFFISNDGLNFTRQFTIAATDFMVGGPDEVGFCASSQTTLYGCSMDVVHFKEYNAVLPIAGEAINF